MKFFVTLLLLVLVALGGAYWLVTTPFGPASETFVEIPPHTSTEQMATQLERAGVIRSRYGFELLRLHEAGTLKAGEYRFDHPAPMTEVYRRIVKGDIFTLGLTIPEGYNIFDIAQAVQNAGLGDRDTFLAAERQHTELIADWTDPATRPASLEGYLFPDTYHFARHTQPLTILTAMVRRFRQAAQQLHLEGPEANRTVIMASLIEKEVSQDSERPLVAGVFVNRLDKKIPLATDPTVIYAALLDNRWRGTIYATDLKSLSPYNTYVHTGLPPGPICNPGMAAFHAAISPAQTDYLYFVSDAAGHSRFAATLKGHNENVQAYRKAQQQR
ncbi:endolytic transglycosylase MltG [Edaphobacter flagellatus]|uniref:endolytic transglycosylase MltG n=1 Tax=Edaphobacter flagellatus TaxID=1933044 RepID=UPI0021B29720|nr:endolytic transglycosylase MltG [Edaphobacter flagellatus]